jgi:colanic acid biosynthesis glycosyl transferase WcaI
MKIIVWGINYAPELTGIAPYNVALCDYLLAQKHDVRMLTSFCYYPAWKKLPEDRGRLFRTDKMKGVPVHRVWHYVPAKVSSLKRIIHEGTFVTLSALRFLFLPKPDALVVMSPPLLLGAAAWFVTRFKRCPFVFHVQDLQPDAAAGLGMIKQGWLMKALFWLEKFAYARAARVGGIMPGMLDAYRRKGVPEKKIFEFPNGVTLPDPAKFPARGGFRQRNGFKADEFIALYSGNLGVKQGLDVLVEAARHVKDPRVRIVICGEGATKEVLVKRVADLGLKNVSMLPLQPEAEYHSMLVDADLCVITQQKGSGKYFFPSKLLTTLAFAKPVLTVADQESELSEAVGKGKFGVSVEPGHAEKLGRELDRIAGNPAGLKELGEAGRRYVAQFDFPVVLRGFETLLTDLAAETKARR